MLYNYVCDRDLNSKYARDRSLNTSQTVQPQQKYFHSAQQKPNAIESLISFKEKILLEMEVFITKFILFQNELLLIKLVSIKKSTPPRNGDVASFCCKHCFKFED